MKTDRQVDGRVNQYQKVRGSGKAISRKRAAPFLLNFISTSGVTAAGHEGYVLFSLSVSEYRPGEGRSSRQFSCFLAKGFSQKT